MHEFNGKFDMVGARTGEPTDRTVEIIENENQRGKRLKKNEQKNQRPYKTTISLPKKGRKEKKKSNERINVSNFQLRIGSYKLLAEKKLLYKFKKPDKPKPKRDKFRETHTYYIVVKLLKNQDKGENLTSFRRKTDCRTTI